LWHFYKHLFFGFLFCVLISFFSLKKEERKIKIKLEKKERKNFEKQKNKKNKKFKN